MKQLNLFSSFETPTADSESQFTDEARLEEELIYKILLGVSLEWKNGIRILDPVYQSQMRLPLFAIKNMKTRLGYWSKRKQEICLSRDLVLNHPWDAIRDVLLHEMAHQMADQVFGCANEPSHGPGFRDACRLLRANPESSGKYPTLDERVANGSDSGADAQLRRIKKLLALAKSHNAHEAQAAMLKAHQLIKKYNINVIRQNESRQFISIFIGTPALRHTRDYYHLSTLLQNFYFVDGIWVSAYVMDKNRMGRVLEITGTRPNIKMASYVYHFVRRFIDSQWQSYNKTKQHKFNRKIDFAVGIIEGFRSKLEREEKKNPSKQGVKALIKIEDPQLKRHMAYKYPHTRNFSRSGGNENDAILKDGIEIGKNLVISKGISSMEKSGKLLME